MICRLPDSNPLFVHASFYFNNSLSYKSWFKQVDELTELYKLPTCIELLNLKLDKESFKKQVKLRLADHWQRILREEASKLKSLKYFRPQFYSVLFPSNSYISAGNNRYEIAKVNVQMKMLSGRYRTESLSRFWSENKSGVCLLGDPCNNTTDTIPHILVSCPVLEKKRAALRNLFIVKESNKLAFDLIRVIFAEGVEEQTQFLLDPLSDFRVIRLVQHHGYEIRDKICYITRTYCFSLHRERSIKLGKWINSGYPAPITDVSNK